jgi:hypothetical protein
MSYIDTAELDEEYARAVVLSDGVVFLGRPREASLRWNGPESAGFVHAEDVHDSTQ